MKTSTTTFRSEQALDVLDAFEGGDWPLAKQLWEALIVDMDIEDMLLYWELLDSKQQAYIKNADRKYLLDPKYEQF